MVEGHVSIRACGFDSHPRYKATLAEWLFLFIVWVKKLNKNPFYTTIFKYIPQKFAWRLKQNLALKIWKT